MRCPRCGRVWGDDVFRDLTQMEEERVSMGDVRSRFRVFGCETFTRKQCIGVQDGYVR